jgi:uncharacterized phage-like protein YoqJ
MIVSCTGHRTVLHEATAIEQARNIFTELGADKVIQGMAIGFDLLAARAAWKEQIPFIGARPWKNHGAPKSWRDRYDWVLNHAAEIVVVTDADDYPGPWVFEVRNRYMIDNSDHLVAWWDGTKKGGTWNAIKYATRTKPEGFITYLEVPRIGKA